MSTRTRFTLRQLEYFQAVARTGQISLAAAEESVTQSAMTAAIAQLEKGLGTLLFERSRQGVTLTHAGHVFLQHATRVLEAAQEASQNPFKVHRQLAGAVSLPASYTVLGYFILPYLAKFGKEHPGITVTPREMDRQQIEAALAANEVEVALALTSNITDLRRYHKLVLARSRRQLWVSAQSPLADLPQASLEDAAPYPYIVPTVDEGDISSTRYWQEAQLQPASFIHTSSMEAVREMVALGFGTTILSDMVYRPWSLDGRRIKAVPLKGVAPPMEVGLIWNKGTRLSPAAEALVKYLGAAVG